MSSVQNHRVVLDPLLIHSEGSLARPSPAVGRVAEILDPLAACPGEPLSLSATIRRGALSTATAHSMVNTLADQGLLQRPPATERHALGPAPIRLDPAAERRDGYAVSLTIASAYRLLDSGDLHPGLCELLAGSSSLTEIKVIDTYPVHQIAAPVFDSEGHAVLAWAAVHQGSARTGREIFREAALVVAAADRVTMTIRGVHPDSRQEEAP